MKICWTNKLSSKTENIFLSPRLRSPFFVQSPFHSPFLFLSLFLFFSAKKPFPPSMSSLRGYGCNGGSGCWRPPDQRRELSTGPFSWWQRQTSRPCGGLVSGGRNTHAVVAVGFPTSVRKKQPVRQTGKKVRILTRFRFLFAKWNPKKIVDGWWLCCIARRIYSSLLVYLKFYSLVCFLFDFRMILGCQRKGLCEKGYL